MRNAEHLVDPAAACDTLLTAGDARLPHRHGSTAAL